MQDGKSGNRLLVRHGQHARDGAQLFSDGLIVENGPTDADLTACTQLGEDFASSIAG